MSNRSLRLHSDFEHINNMFEELFKYKNKNGIYKITNKINSKCYIGQSTNLWKRIRDGHISKLRLNNHDNKHFQNSWNKYGEENFIFEIIEECALNELQQREQHWINYYNSANIDNGYNINPIAGNGCFIKHTEEWCKNHSKIISGENNPMYNKAHSEESKRIIALNTMKSTFQIDTTGKLLNIFESSIEASNNTGLCSENIRQARCGKNATCGGYIWLDEYSYYNENREKIIQDRILKMNKNKQSIIQLTLDNKYINTYSSIRQAQRETNVFNISSVISGKLKSAGGYKWIKEENYN